MNIFSRLFSKQTDTALAATPAANKTAKSTRVLPWNLKSVSRIRQNIKTWNEALATAQSDTPKNYALQLLYNEIKIDALLSSQIENRIQQVLGIDFKLKNASGEVDEEQTMLLRKMPAFRQIMKAVLEERYYGYSLIELDLKPNIDNVSILDVINLPRTNIVPQTGLFYTDYSEDKAILYREMPEFGTWILEFNSGDLGLLNSAVSHVVFKRFAQSCWSELCEIYGIPPRVLKTNTQDPTMLKRGEQMMRDMGAAAWFIIDESESFEFAESTSTNGDVYSNLIKLCSDEITLLISGAIIGQDTVNGNRSKEESSQKMLSNLIKSDMASAEAYWDHTILPALVKIGVLKGPLTCQFEQSKDLDQLWKFTSGSLQYFNVNPDFIKTNFGIDITGERVKQETPPTQKVKQKFSVDDFFD